MDAANPSKLIKPLYYTFNGILFVVTYEHHVRPLREYLCKTYNVEDYLTEVRRKDDQTYKEIGKVECKEILMGFRLQQIERGNIVIDLTREEGYEIPDWIMKKRSKYLNMTQIPYSALDRVYAVDPDSTFSSKVDNCYDLLTLSNYGKHIGENLKAGHLLMTYEESEAFMSSLLESKYKLEAIEEIAEDRYNFLLECTSPQNWTNGIFQMVEYTVGKYTGHVVDMGGRYFYGILHNRTNYRSIKSYIRENLM